MEELENKLERDIEGNNKWQGREFKKERLIEDINYMRYLLQYSNGARYVRSKKKRKEAI